MNDFLHNLLDLSLDAAPWLLLGLVIGGLIKSLMPTRLLGAFPEGVEVRRCGLAEAVAETEGEFFEFYHGALRGAGSFGFKCGWSYTFTFTFTFI